MTMTMKHAPRPSMTSLVVAHEVARAENDVARSTWTAELDTQLYHSPTTSRPC